MVLFWFQWYYFKAIVQSTCCAEFLQIRLAGPFFSPPDKNDDPGFQGRDLGNSQMGILPKSVLLYFELYEIIQKAS